MQGRPELVTMSKKAHLIPSLSGANRLPLSLKPKLWPTELQTLNRVRLLSMVLVQAT